MGKLVLRVITPKGCQEEIECDSVRVNAADNAVGKGGGAYGIRPGHAKAVIALEEGRLMAFMAGKCLLSASCGAGIAAVDAGSVTLITENCDCL